MGSLLEELAGDTAFAFLEGIVDRNFPLTLELKRGSAWLRYRSRFLGMAAAAGDVWIDTPISPVDEQPHPLEPDQAFLGSFVYDQSCYRFTSRAIRTGRYILAGGQRVDGIVVSQPAALQKIERRNFYRVPVGTSSPVAVALWHGGCDSRPAAGDNTRPILRGRLANISIGGVLVRLSGANPRMSYGDTIGLEFLLEPDGSVIKTEASIRRSGKLPNGLFELAIRFAGLELTAEGRKTLTYLSQALARMERKNIRRRHWFRE